MTERGIRLQGPDPFGGGWRNERALADDAFHGVQQTVNLKKPQVRHANVIGIRVDERNAIARAGGIENRTERIGFALEDIS